jgi:septin family protein
MRVTSDEAKFAVLGYLTGGSGMFERKLSKEDLSESEDLLREILRELQHISRCVEACAKNNLATAEEVESVKNLIVADMTYRNVPLVVYTEIPESLRNVKIDESKDRIDI